MVPLTDRDWEVFSTRLEQVDFPKKTLLLKAGQTEHYLSFLEKGVIRYYFPDIDRELTFDFGFEGEFASGYDSFLTRQPSMYQIETLVPSVLWRISYEGLQEGLSSYPRRKQHWPTGGRGTLPKEITQRKVAAQGYCRRKVPEII